MFFVKEKKKKKAIPNIANNHSDIPNHKEFKTNTLSLESVFSSFQVFRFGVTINNSTITDVSSNCVAHSRKKEVL